MANKKVLTYYSFAILLFSLLLTSCSIFTPPTTEETSLESLESDNVSETENTPFIVGISNRSNDDFFDNLRVAELQDIIESNSDIQFIMNDAQDSIDLQMEQIDSFIEQHVSAVVITPANYELIAPGILKLNEANIPVICYGIKASSGTFCYIGSSDLDAGRMQGKFLAENLEPDAKILYLAGDSKLFLSKEREEGMLYILKSQRSDITILDSQDGKYNAAPASQIMSDWIQTYDDFDAVVAANDVMALSAIQVLKVNDRLDGTIVIGIDGTSQEALDAIENGEMAMTVFQNANEQAIQCMNVLEDLKNGISMPEYVNIPFEEITIDNVKDFETE